MMIGLVMMAAWLTILLTLFTRGLKFHWTDMLIWVVAISIGSTLIGVGISAIAGGTAGKIAEQIAMGGGFLYLLVDRYGIRDLRTLVPLVILLYVPPVLYSLFMG